MLGVDTNVLVRFFTRDDQAQFEEAQRLVAGAGEGGLYIDPIVLVEFNWVLRRVYGMTRKEVFLVLDGLFEAREFTIGDRDLAREALQAAVTTGADYADALIAAMHQKAGCRSTATFDERAQRLDQMVAVSEAIS